MHVGCYEILVTTMENGKLKSSVGMKFGIVSSRQKIKLTRVKKSAQKFSV